MINVSRLMPPKRQLIRIDAPILLHHNRLSAIVLLLIHCILYVHGEAGRLKALYPVAFPEIRSGIASSCT